MTRGLPPSQASGEVAIGDGGCQGSRLRLGRGRCYAGRQRQSRQKSRRQHHRLVISILSALNFSIVLFHFVLSDGLKYFLNGNDVLKAAAARHVAESLPDGRALEYTTSNVNAPCALPGVAHMGCRRIEQF